MPPLEQLQRVPLFHLDALGRQGIFTTGLLLEVSETPTRRQYLADQINAEITDVNDWRDEALLLNLANFGQDEQALFTEAGIIGLSDLVALNLDEFRAQLTRAARVLGTTTPTDLITEGWWEQAHTLRDE